MAWLWVIIYWIVDVKKVDKWTKILAPAGQSPLFAYILAPIVALVLEYIGLIFGNPEFYYQLGETYYIGLVRAIVMAFGLIWLTAFLRRTGINLKL